MSQDKTKEETSTAKLRNLLSPLYGLPSTVLLLATRMDDKSKEILCQMCETAIVSTDKIKPLIEEIEHQLSEAKVEIERLEKELRKSTH